MTEKNFIKTITTFPFLTEEELDGANLIHNTTEEIKNSIKYAFEYYGIHCNCIALFDKWAISEDKDIVNISPQCSYYPLLSNNPELKTVNEIFDQLGSKDWFKNDPKLRSSLVNALSYCEYKFKEFK